MPLVYASLLTDLKQRYAEHMDSGCVWEHFVENVYFNVSDTGQWNKGKIMDWFK